MVPGALSCPWPTKHRGNAGSISDPSGGVEIAIGDSGQAQAIRNLVTNPRNNDLVSNPFVATGDENNLVGKRRPVEGDDLTFGTAVTIAELEEQVPIFGWQTRDTAIPFGPSLVDGRVMKELDLDFIAKNPDGIGRVFAITEFIDVVMSRPLPEPKGLPHQIPEIAEEVDVILRREEQADEGCVERESR